MKRITIIEDAHIEGYEGAFCHEIGEDGQVWATGVWDNWYEASAIDDDGDDYIVYWTILEDYDASEDAEDCACNWDKPWMVVDKNGKNVVNKVEVNLN